MRVARVSWYCFGFFFFLTMKNEILLIHNGNTFTTFTSEHENQTIRNIIR